MEPSAALADLMEISSQIRAAVLFDGTGKVTASTVDPDRSPQLVESARALFEEAERVRSSGNPLAQLEIGTPDGSVFLVRDDDRFVLATTESEPTVGLVFYDLKTCLRNADSTAQTRPQRETVETEPGNATA